MLGRDFAGTTANIAQTNTPNFVSTRPNMRDSILDAINTYYSIDEKERSRKEKERLAGLEQNLTDAIKSGDEEAINNAYAEINPSGYIEGINDARNKRELEELKTRNSMDLETLKNQFAYNLAKDKIGWQLAADKLSDSEKRTNNIVNYEYLVRNGMPEEEARAFAFPVNTEAIGNAIATGSLGGLGEAGQSAYDRERGKQLAQAEEKTKTKISNINNQVGNLTNLINNIQENPETVGFQSGPATVAARVAGLFGSKTAGDYLKKRGGVIRQLASIQNDLINQARDAGQSGINTISEIRQITRGLNENSSDQEVIGALIAMKDSAQRLSRDLQNGTTNNPTKSFTSIPTDKDAWGGI